VFEDEFVFEDQFVEFKLTTSSMCVLICVFSSSKKPVVIEEKEVSIIEVKDVKNLAALRCLRMNLLNSNLPLLQY
jgi:hypothetical protein